MGRISHATVRRGCAHEPARLGHQRVDHIGSYACVQLLQALLGGFGQKLADFLNQRLRLRTDPHQAGEGDLYGVVVERHLVLVSFRQALKRASHRPAHTRKRLGRSSGGASGPAYPEALQCQCLAASAKLERGGVALPADLLDETRDGMPHAGAAGGHDVCAGRTAAYQG